ncbi:MAG TPA: hypothetical protein VGL24_05660 [Chthoniobacterales bacterium]|jgi:anti-sigma factor RsiW
MAAEHLNLDEVQAAARGDLPPHDLLRASEHLASCPECRVRVRAITGLPAAPFRADEEEEISYEILADYLDDKLDPLRRLEVSEQLRRSPRAAEDLESLRSFRAETNALTDDGRANEQTGRRSKVIGFPRASTLWILPLAALLLLTIGGLWWQSRSRSGGETLVTSEALQRLPSDLRAAVVAAASTGKLEISSQVQSWAGERERLAGPNEAAPGFRLVRPMASALRETRPEFEWTARTGASGYRVLVVEIGSGELVATGLSDGAQTKWQPSTPLRAGESYQWQVQALHGTDVLERVPRPPAPEARFSILATQARNDFEKVQAESPGSHLIVAVAAARVGLLATAEEELRALAKGNPDSKIPNELLEQVEATRRSR